MTDDRVDCSIAMSVACVSYNPGHLTDKALARQIMRISRTGAASQVVAVHSDGTVILDYNGTLLELWHHAPEAIERLLGPEGHVATYYDPPSYLMIRPSGSHVGQYGFYLVSKAERTSCL